MTTSLPNSSRIHNVGIIGLGRSGWDIHARGLLALKDKFRVSAVTDPVASRRDEAVELWGCTAHLDAEAVINDPDVDIVVIASPSHTHVDLGLLTLAAGKHAILEKPMAASVDDIDRLVAASAAADRVVTCFHNNRFEGSLAAVGAIVASGRIGEPILIRRCIHRYSRRADWQTLRKFGGGELANQVSHYLDQVLSLVPDSEVSLLAADVRHVVSAGDAEDHAKLILRAAGGPLLEVEGSAAVAIPQPAWFVVGTAGTISGSTRELAVRWVDPATLPEITADDGPAEDRRYGSAEVLPWQEETVMVESTNRTTIFYQNFYDVLEHGAELAITPASVRRQIGLINQARTTETLPTS